MADPTFPVQAALLLAVAICPVTAAAGPDSRPATRPAGRGVYSCDFEKQAGWEWSQTKRDTTPNGKRSYLGQFGKETVSLTLAKLPPHKFLRISFDLYLIRTWDGVWGDTWRLAVEGGPTLVHASFSNIPVEGAGGGKQSYPARPGRGALPSRTGAAEKGTLGYTWTYGGQPRQVDAVYRMALLFAHRGKSIRFNFRGLPDEVLSNESWGLDNVRVEALGEAPQKDLPHPQFQKLWGDLGSTDAVRAHTALRRLVAAGDRAAVLLRKQLALPQRPPKGLAPLIRELDDPRFVVRRRAHQALRARGMVAVPILRRAAEASASAELRAHAAEILEQILPSQAPETPRIERAIWVLDLLRAEPLQPTTMPAPRG